MQRESRKLLLDARDAAASIRAFSENRIFDDLLNDKLLRSGIYYQFVIVGEALARLRQIDQGTFDRITESWKIVGFRNQIIHGYGVVQDNVTWQIVQDKLPVLINELDALLRE